MTSEWRSGRGGSERDGRSDFLGLAQVTPEILDHFVLKSRGHRTGQPTSDGLRHDATERHRKFRAAHGGFLAGDNSMTARGVLKMLAELLFVVRSNIAHGEKTPCGPDLEKVRRDEQASAVASQVLTLFVPGETGRAAGRGERL